MTYIHLVYITGYIRMSRIYYARCKIHPKCKNSYVEASIDRICISELKRLCSHTFVVETEGGLVLSIHGHAASVPTRIGCYMSFIAIFSCRDWETDIAWFWARNLSSPQKFEKTDDDFQVPHRRADVSCGARFVQALQLQCRR